MNSAGPQQRPDVVQATERRLTPSPRKEDQRFRLSLGAALLVHALFFASFFSARPRQLGDPSGIDGAISVDLATEADLGSRSTVAEAGGAEMKPSVDDQPEAAPPVLLPMQSPPPAPEPPPQPAKAPAPEPAVTPKTQPQKPAAESSSPPITLAEAMAMLEAMPAPQGKAPVKTTDARQPQQTPAKPSQQKPAANPTLTTKLDLSIPQSALMQQAFVGGRGGVERPPGVTRSGENDDFARGVVRSLQGTMPQLRDTVGRVTVRITLDARGNLANTQVVRTSGSAALDQNVVFATKQTNFPIPPRGHVPQDLIFLVTYVYR